jgi:hypothetical protein
MPATKRPNRRAQILQALASMLQSNPGQRITTAKLAAHVYLKRLYTVTFQAKHECLRD